MLPIEKSVLDMRPNSIMGREVFRKREYYALSRNSSDDERECPTTSSHYINAARISHDYGSWVWSIGVDTTE